jgi:hypothetical protein
MRGVEIGVAYATGLGLDQDLAWPGGGDVPIGAKISREPDT